MVRSRMRAHIGQADSQRGLLDTVPSRSSSRPGGCKLHGVAHLSVLELGKATWPNDVVDAKGNIYLSSSGPYSLDAAPKALVFIDVESGVPRTW
jgi:hypothetical protein